MLNKPKEESVFDNVMLILGGGILLMLAIGMPQLGWSPVMYGGSARCFVAGRQWPPEEGELDPLVAWIRKGRDSVYGSSVDAVQSGKV